MKGKTGQMLFTSAGFAAHSDGPWLDGAASGPRLYVIQGRKTSKKIEISDLIMRFTKTTYNFCISLGKFGRNVFSRAYVSVIDV
jgi:hypothetical protein